jgi:hypothetical protein
MKLNGKWGGALIAAALTCAGMTQAQELKNTSFEEPDTTSDNPYGDRAENWGRWGNWMNRESNWTPTKSGSCLIGYHHWEIQEKDSSGLYQDVEGIPAGKEVTFSINAMNDADIVNVELRLEKLGGKGTLASKFFTPAEIKKNSWTQLSVTGKTTDDGIRVLVIVNPKVDAPRAGATKFDDAELKVK